MKNAHEAPKIKDMTDHNAVIQDVFSQLKFELSKSDDALTISLDKTIYIINICKAILM